MEQTNLEQTRTNKFGRKETAGSLARKAMLSKRGEGAIRASEVADEMQKGYMKEIYSCAEKSKNIYPDDFFIVVITKKDRLLETMGDWFFSRWTCPTPDYDQAVFKYIRASGAAHFIWKIPGKQECIYFIENQCSISPTKYGLLSHVLAFQDGSLNALAKKLNGEKKDTNELETNELERNRWNTQAWNIPVTKKFQETYSTILKEVPKVKESPTTLDTQKKHQSSNNHSQSQTSLSQTSLLLTNQLGKTKLQNSSTK